MGKVHRVMNVQRSWGRRVNDVSCPFVADLSELIIFGALVCDAFSIICFEGTRDLKRDAEVRKKGQDVVVLWLTFGHSN